MNAEKIVFIVLFYVTVVGALNWGFHAAGYNLVEKLAGAVAGDNAKSVENGIYYVVALCGLAAAVMYANYLYKKNKKDQPKQ